MGIIDSGDKVRRRIAGIGSCLVPLISDAVHIMTMIIIGVIDRAATGMRDCQNFTNASRRRRSANIIGGVHIGVSHQIDIPIRIVTQVRTVSLKIGIVRQELLRSRANVS